MASNSYKESENTEEPLEEVKEEPKKKKRKANPVFSGVHSVLDGTILTRDRVVKSLPFLFYMAFIAILYIANSYYAEKKIMEIEKMKKDLKEMRSEYVSTKSKLMFYSRQSEVIKRIGSFGIKESMKPPHKIYTEKDTTKNSKDQD
jgi:hypothetical protein